MRRWLAYIRYWFFVKKRKRLASQLGPDIKHLLDEGFLVGTKICCICHYKCLAAIHPDTPVNVRHNLECSECHRETAIFNEIK